MYSHTRILTWLFLGSLVCVRGASAQPFLPFHDVPVVSAHADSVLTFRQIFSRGHCETIRAIVLGDSQETCPLGLGVVYIPRLNYELFLRYGNVPETPLAGPQAHNGGAPWADWVLRNSNAGPGVTSSRLSTATLPPLLLAGKSSTTNGDNVNGDQWYGGLYVLQHSSAHIDPAAAIDHSRRYFKRGEGVYMDVFAATNPSSGEITARVTPNTNSSPSYYQPTVSTIAVNMGLQQSVFEIKRQRIGPLPFNGRDYMQVELSGSDDAKFTDILGARYVSIVDDRGWAITSFAAGGYRASYILSSHGGCGPVLAALEPDVVFLAFGVNDFSSGVSPVQFQDATLNLIAFLREHTHPNLPIILLAEADRMFAGLPDSFATNFDQLAGVLHFIAQTVPDVCAVNGRLLTHQQGWTRQGDLAPFLADNVHYNANGAILKARLEIDALYAAFGTRCVIDLDDGTSLGTPDCGIDISDLLYFLVTFEQGATAADLDDDGDGASSNPDGAVDVNDLLYFLARFEIGC
jgi:lysophospholipase L1-like esterase